MFAEDGILEKEFFRGCRQFGLLPGGALLPQAQKQKNQKQNKQGNDADQRLFSTHAPSPSCRGLS